MLDKNDIVELEVVDSGMDFEGIAKIDGKTIFLPGAIIGEKILAKIIKKNSSYLIGRVENIIKNSDMRVEPFCDVYKRCGGCNAAHIVYDMQLLLKNKMVKNELNKQKVNYKSIDNIIGMGMPYYYRNKVQYPVRINSDNITNIGFYSKRSHEIIPNSCCYIQNRVIDILAKEVLDKLIYYGFTGYNEIENTGDIRHIIIRRGYHTQEIMITIVINESEILDDNRFLGIAKELTNGNNNIKSIFLNLNDSITNEIMGDKLKKIYGSEYISDYIGEFKYCISPKSFFQINTLQAEVLYFTLKERLDILDSDIIFDLYSGVGAIGIFLSKEAREVYGIEIEKDAVEMANLNIITNNITNAYYISGSVEDKIVEFKEKEIKPDIIVVDPPRKGLDKKSIEHILEFNPKKIGYVSCNPSTLARDLKLLEKRYSIFSITPVDLFPQTSHVECVVVLCRK